jgi:hypothetical protein
MTSCGAAFGVAIRTCLDRPGRAAGQAQVAWPAAVFANWTAEILSDAQESGTDLIVRTASTSSTVPGVSGRSATASASCRRIQSRW